VIYLKSKTFSSIKGHYFSFCARKSVHYQQLILWENFSFTNEKTGFALQFTNNLLIKHHIYYYTVQSIFYFFCYT